MEIIKLNQFADIFSGFAFSTDDMKDDGTPILKIGNIVGDGTLSLITDSFYPHLISRKLEKFYLRNTDYLVCMTGATIGKIGRDTSIEEKSYLVNQRVGIIRPYDNIENNYLYYLLSLKDFRKYIELVGSGAAQANISAKNIGKFKLKCVTDKSQQIKISKILNKYDLMIDINSKKIGILEDIAYSLYKEWFIHYRYPNFETQTLVECKPRGWILSSNKKVFCPKTWHFGDLKEIGLFVRGRNITAEQMIDGNIPVISAGLEPSGYHNEANIFGESLTISASGANAGYLSYHLADIWAADCSYCQSEKHIWFIYNALKFLQPVISNMQCGAAQPHVYPKNLNRLCTIIPPESLIDLYCEKVNPIYKQIKVLEDENENLIKQRDLLLPRLMSGKLDIEGKEII